MTIRLLATCALCLLLGSAANAYVPTVLEQKVAARAAGNRLEEAQRLARVLLAEPWAVQLTKIRVDGANGHLVVGIILSGLKFHTAIRRADFEREVAQIVRTSFKTGDYYEVDVWATVPIPVAKDAIVAGDYAVPTSRIVFSYTVPKTDSAAVDARLTAGKGVYYALDFLSRLSK